MKRIIILLLLINFSNFLFAQEDKSRVSNMGFFFGGIWSMHDLDELNNSLSYYNQESLENSTIGFSGGVLIGNIQQPLFFSVEIAAAMQTPRSGGSEEIIFSTMSMCVNANMNLFKNPKNFLYPTVGFGFSTLNLQITDINKVSSDFEEALQNLEGERSLYTSPIYYINFGLGYDRKMRFFSKGKPFYLGVRAGYKLKVSKETDWGAGGYQVENAPDINIGGFYASLILSLY